MIKKITGFLFLSTAFVFSSMANAQPGVCHEDAVKFCKGDVGGQKKMIACLSQHMEEVTPACKTHILTVKEGRKGFRGTCRKDRLKFCKDVKPGQGRVASCLLEHLAELSPNCKKQFE